MINVINEVTLFYEKRVTNFVTAVSKLCMSMEQNVFYIKLRGHNVIYKHFIRTG